MKAKWFYFLVNGLTVLLIWAVMQAGKGLRAPPALPDHWSTVGITPDAECRLFQPKDHPLLMKQSGENLSMVWTQAPYLELHGKIDRQGQFELAGQLMGRKREGCKRAKVVWKGKGGPQELTGRLAILSPTCSLCPGGMDLKAVAHEPPPATMERH